MKTYGIYGDLFKNKIIELIPLDILEKIKVNFILSWLSEISGDEISQNSLRVLINLLAQIGEDPSIDRIWNNLENIFDESVVNNHVKYLKAREALRKKPMDISRDEYSEEEISVLFSDEMVNKIGINNLIYGNKKLIFTLAKEAPELLNNYREFVEIAYSKSINASSIEFSNYRIFFENKNFDLIKDILAYGNFEFLQQALEAGDTITIEQYKKEIILLKDIGQSFEVKEYDENIKKYLSEEWKQKVEKRIEELDVKITYHLIISLANLEFLDSIIDDDEKLKNYLNILNECYENTITANDIQSPELLTKDVVEKLGETVMAFASEEQIRLLLTIKNEEAIKIYRDFVKKSIKDNENDIKKTRKCVLTEEVLIGLGANVITHIDFEDLKALLAEKDLEKRKWLFSIYKELLDEEESPISQSELRFILTPEKIKKINEAIEQNLTEDSKIRNLKDLLRYTSLDKINRNIKKILDYIRYVETELKNGNMYQIVSEMHCLENHSNPIVASYDKAVYVGKNIPVEKQREIYGRTRNTSLMITPNELTQLDMGDSVTLLINNVSELTVEQLKELDSKYGVYKIIVVDMNNFNSYEMRRRPYTVEEYIAIKTKIDNILVGIDSAKEHPERELEIFKEVYKRLSVIEYDKAALMLEEGDPGYEDCRSLVSGLIDGKCVCAGYAEILRNVLACVGIEAISILGAGNMADAHAWNQVKIGGKWYNVDLTWDSKLMRNGKEPMFCLKNDEEFEGHERFSRIRSQYEKECDGYDSIEFASPMPLITLEQVLTSSSAMNVAGNDVIGAQQEIEKVVVENQEKEDKEKEDKGKDETEQGSKEVEK